MAAPPRVCAASVVDVAAVAGEGEVVAGGCGTGGGLVVGPEGWGGVHEDHLFIAGGLGAVVGADRDGDAAVGLERGEYTMISMRARPWRQM